MKTKNVEIIEKLNTTAREWVLHRNIREWNMLQLAAECGLTKRTLYKMIESKEKLIEDVILETIRAVQEDINLILTSGDNYRETLEEAAYKFPELLNILASSKIGEIYREYPGIEKAVIEKRNELVTGLCSYMQRGIEHSNIRPECEPESIVEYLQAITLYYLKQDLSIEIRRKKISASLNILFKGILND